MIKGRLKIWSFSALAFCTSVALSSSLAFSTSLALSSILSFTSMLICSAQPAVASNELPVSGAGTAGIDRAALDHLIKRAGETHSDALVVVREGRLVGQWNFGHKSSPILTKSITKSIASLAIGCLIDDGKIKSLEQPISDFFPESSKGEKHQITLKHILANTSGIDAADDYDGPDFIQIALAARMKSKPGTEFVYNNKAVNLLAGIVKVASGKPIDQYIAQRIFSPLGISDDSWQRDKAKNPVVMGGLFLSGMDLAKIGQMMLDGGTWHGRRIVSKAWLEKSTTPGLSVIPEYGLLWWVLPGSTAAGAAKSARLIGFRGNGYMGQNLIVLPKAKLVVVRLISKENYKCEDDAFCDIVDCAKMLVSTQNKSRR